MDRISNVKSSVRRFLLGAFALGWALNAPGLHASQTSLEYEESSGDGRSSSDSSGRTSPVRLSQKRERAEMSRAYELEHSSSTMATRRWTSSESVRSSTWDSTESFSSSSSRALCPSLSQDSSGSEDERHTRGVSTRLHGSSQTYAVPTYDGTFKHLMSHEDMLQSFLDAFIPDEKIEVVRLLDNHLRPFAEYENARAFLNKKQTSRVAEKLSALLEENEVKDNEFSISFTNAITAEENSVHGGSEFIKGFAEIYGDILRGYPLPERNSQVDVLCKVEGGGYAIVEMQIAEESYWDKRALAYAANRYGRQLSEGHKWDDIKKIICINILGGGEEQYTWKTHTRFRKLTFKDQYNIPIEDGIEIFQYPLYHESLRQEADKRRTEKERTAFLDWVTFFESANRMKESEACQVKTEKVRQAYELIKSEHLPKRVLDQNLEQERELSRYGERLTIERDEGREEGAEHKAVEVAKKLLHAHLDDQIICDATGLSLLQITELKSGLSSPN